MTFDWQNIVALGAAASACAYLVWRGYATIKGKRTNCGGCASYPTAGASGAKQLVKIELVRKNPSGN